MEQVILHRRQSISFINAEWSLCINSEKKKNNAQIGIRLQKKTETQVRLEQAEEMKLK